MAKYDINSTKLGELLDDPQVVAIFDKHAPGLTNNPMLGMAKGMTAGQAMSMAGGMVGQDKLAAIKAEVEAL
ncbi:hypothetical protein [Austwickia chelonae]|uniref:hypothetical protein n=1 Tax=Austwickia chelonae TaxID=100225 RepID=UPI000E273EF7|nr:hypothetical protein [Austwickia chelonae]